MPHPRIKYTLNDIHNIHLYTLNDIQIYTHDIHNPSRYALGIMNILSCISDIYTPRWHVLTITYSCDDNFTRRC